MRGIHALTRTAWLIAIGLAACAPASDIEGLGNDVDPGELGARQQAAPYIDIAPSSPISLAMRGGIGPIVEGQTVNAAYVTLQSIQLVGMDGNVVPLLDQPVTLDLLAAQNSLDELASQIALPPGRFSHMRCQLGGVFIETAADQGGVQFYATPGMDVSQFGATGPVGPLALEALQPDGFFDVAIPEDGIAVQGATSLAMQIDLAASLMFRDGSWIFSPRAWVVDESVFSSLDVRFEAEASGFGQFVDQGAEVMLFDAGMRPISYAPLAMLPGGVPGASFQYLAPFQGPFVAVLVPPPGIQLTSVVSTSVDIVASVHAQTSIVINSFQQVSSVGGVTSFAIGAASQASFIQRSSSGVIIRQGMVPVGPIQAIAPNVRPRIPLVGGQAPLPPLGRVPYLRGLPAPAWAGPGIRPGGPPRFREGHHRFPGQRPGRPGGPGMRPPVTRPGERPGRQPGIRPPSRPGVRPGGPGIRPPVTRPGERPGRQPGIQSPPRGPAIPGFRGIEAPSRGPSIRQRATTPRGGSPPVIGPERSTEPHAPGVMRPTERPFHRPTPAEDRVPMPLPRGLMQPQGPERGHRPESRRPAVRRGELHGDTATVTDAPEADEE